jgi:peptidoglycan/LPS O-acetylase OafA/YrhL
MDGIAMGATIAVIARSSTGLASVRRLAPIVAAIALAGLAAIEILELMTSYRLGITFALATRCTLFVSLWGALVVGVLTAVPGGFLQYLTYSIVLRTFGKYSYALYLFHMHMNPLFAKLGFDPIAGVTLGGSVLPWQILYVALASAASLLLAYLSWHLYEKHFLRLKAFFDVRKRIVSVPAVLSLTPVFAAIHVAPASGVEPKGCSAEARNNP